MTTISTQTRVPDNDGELVTWFAERASDVDRNGADVRDGLRWLGQRGLLDTAAPHSWDGGLLPLLGTVESVARACLSSAFSLWGQRMVIEYLSRAPGTPYVSGLLDQLRTGEITGSSHMAPALKEISGVGDVVITARRTDGGYVLNGPIPWASNLFPDAVVVLPARLSDSSDDDSDRIIATVRVGAPGVRIRDYPELMALNATASSSGTLEEVFVADEAVVSTDLSAFCSQVRPTLLLVQTAFCTGLTTASLAQARESLSSSDSMFDDDLDTLEGELAGQRERLGALATTPPQPRAATQLRLDAALLAQSATRLEATAKGGAGYMAKSATSRRLREAAFLPVQSPTEGHLRWDLRN
ncbi:acyl-CoA/acyl-ACP dehydrogenase [Spiractinospora alimapuensis]|uniref:acyl-CoA dehydrogenase family protein n=1 Tax=Spiractinospora alimapuensis TaxID=2820884 RepID=UPI001F2290CF|nr:acyl-CoA dehydrogenase family protein [Spiractinospora alimapuensis]QVQ50012.1 acyl-CoA/acyl-ACP dehydrogenase [Spiractinospora alimapuensis]